MLTLGVSCGKPLIKEGMILTGHSYLYNESLTISCPSGMYAIILTKLCV